MSEVNYSFQNKAYEENDKSHLLLYSSNGDKFYLDRIHQQIFYLHFILTIVFNLHFTVGLSDSPDRKAIYHLSFFAK